MADITARRQQAIDQLAGNESLLDMLETEAAEELLDWGIAMASSLVQATENLDDASAEAVLEPQLKAVRQAMRSIGNWAAGKYTDPEDRLHLREKLLGHFRTILGEEASLPPAEELDAVLNRVDDPESDPHPLILSLKEMLDPAP